MIVFIYLYIFLSTDPNIDKEHAELAERTHQMACEAFGDGAMPKLETAVYKVRKKHSSWHLNISQNESEDDLRFYVRLFNFSPFNFS